MAIPSLVQHREVNAASTAAFTGANTAKNLLTACINWASTSITVGSITSSAGNQWVRAPNTYGGNAAIAGGYSCEIWYAKNCNAATDSITLVFSGGTPADSSIGLQEWSGADIISPFDQGSFGFTASGTTASAPSLVLTRKNQIILAYLVPNVGSTGVGAGYTLIVIDSFSDLYEYKDITTPGTYAVTGAMASGAAIMSAASFSEPWGTSSIFFGMDF